MAGSQNLDGFGYQTKEFAAADLSVLLAGMAGANSRGVISNYSDKFAVSESGTPAMSVDVAAGAALVGLTLSFAFMQQQAATTLAIDAADGSNPRWDLICLTRDASSGVRQSKLEVVTGTPAASPADPSLTQTEEKYQMPIARVVVGTGVSTIVDANITDLRSFTLVLQQDATAIVKGSDESVTSSTTLQNDDDFQIPVEANGTYLVWGTLLLFSASVTPDIKCQWSVPSGAEVDMSAPGEYNSGSGASVWTVTEAAARAINLQAGVILPTPFTGVIRVSGSAGTAVLQWAQNTSDGTAASILAGSTLLYKKVA